MPKVITAKKMTFLLFASIALLLVIRTSEGVLVEAARGEYRRAGDEGSESRKLDYFQYSSRVRGQSSGDQQHASGPRNLQMDVMDFDCGGMGMTCSPSAAPSYSSAPSHVPSGSPSVAPSLSSAPTLSQMPSSSPSLSLMPSESPSSAPSSMPSELPSQVPSLKPSAMPSEAPSISSAPSEEPSEQPSDIPSSSPSAEPSGLPSAPPTLSSQPSSMPSMEPSLQPTMTHAPTVDPGGYQTKLFAGPDNLPQRNSTCRPALPGDATNIQQQLVRFDYAANLLPDSNATLALSAISLRLQSELSKEYLDCDFDEQKDFYTYAISSMPPDQLGSRACSASEQTGGTGDIECYTANGAFVANIFYLPSGSNGVSRERQRELQKEQRDHYNRKLLNTAISDPVVLESFSVSLQNIFASGALTGSRVVSTPFEGITNGGTTDPPPAIEAPPAESRNVAAIAGGTVGGVVTALLIALALFVGIKRHRDRERGEHYGEEVGGDENELLERDEDELNATGELISTGEGEEEEQQGPSGEPGGGNDSEEEDGNEEEKTDIGLEEKLRVVVVNEEEDTLASAIPLRRPLPEEQHVDEPRPPRFLTQQEIHSPRVYNVSDTVDL